MSDKREALVDNGWQNMEALLDANMPIKKKRRRVLWIPIMGAITIILIGIGIVWSAMDQAKPSQNDTKEIVIAQQNQNHQKIESERGIDAVTATTHNDPSIQTRASDKVVHDNVEVNTTNTENANIGQTNVNKTNSNSSSIISNPLGASLTKTSLTNTTPPSKQSSLNISKSRTAIYAQQNEYIDSKYTPKQQSTYQELIDNSNQPLSPILSGQNSNSFILMNALDVLSIMPLGLTSQLNNPNHDAVSSPIVNEKNYKGHFGMAISTGWLIQEGFTMPGISVDYTKKLNERFGVSGRLSYYKGLASDRSQSGSLENDQFSSMDQMDNTSLSTPELELIPTEQNIAISDINAFEAAFLVRYDLTPRLSSFIGPGVVHSMYSDQFSDLSSGSRAIAVPEISSSATRILAIGGIGFNWTNRLSTTLEYAYYPNGLLPYDPSTSSEDVGSQQRTSIGLKYGF